MSLNGRAIAPRRDMSLSLANRQQQQANQLLKSNSVLQSYAQNGGAIAAEIQAGSL